MSNVIKFQTPFERIKLYNTSPDINLRKAIITQAIIDASNISESNKEAKKFEIEAKNWIFGNNKTFHDTCIEADMSPSFIRKIAREVIKLHKQEGKSIDRKNDRRRNKVMTKTRKLSTYRIDGTKPILEKPVVFC